MPQIHIESDVTGRDSYIIVKALAYAIATIEGLPECRQEVSDCEDMAALLKALCPNEAQRNYVVFGVRAHMGLNN
jgi:hypothetical protein